MSKQLKVSATPEPFQNLDISEAAPYSEDT